MTQKNKKQFGVWMDTHHATVVGKINTDSEEFTVLGSVENAGAEHNSSEKNLHNDARALQRKFFKTILSYMQNAELIHITGTGTSQEQFIHFLADTPQYKNTLTQESTLNKMSDEKLVAFFASKFN